MTRGKSEGERNHDDMYVSGEKRTWEGQRREGNEGVVRLGQLAGGLDSL